MDSRQEPSAFGGLTLCGACLPGTLLLGQIDEVLRGMGSKFHQDNKLGVAELTAVIGLVVVTSSFLWALARLMNRQEGRRLYNSPRHLFWSLSRTHELNRGQRRLLSQVAKEAGLTHWAVLFVDPSYLREAAESSTFAGLRTGLQELENRLFCDLNESDEEISLGDSAEETALRTLSELAVSASSLANISAASSGPSAVPSAGS